MPTRAKWTRFFLWISVLTLGTGVGAKLFDHMVLARAWSANPPASLGLLPYGPHYPVDTGDFFQPLGLLILIGILGALVFGWNTPFKYRLLLLAPLILISPPG